MGHCHQETQTRQDCQEFQQVLRYVCLWVGGMHQKGVAHQWEWAGECGGRWHVRVSGVDFGPCLVHIQGDWPKLLLRRNHSLLSRYSTVRSTNITVCAMCVLRVCVIF